MQVAITIDTEEDDWGSFEPRGATARNIHELGVAQELFEEYGARPTYFVNLAPLQQEDTRSVIRRLSGREAVEIGAHCHPWNTPPIDPGEAHVSMMGALDEATNRAKLGTVTNAIEEVCGRRPRSFRAGRWGFGPTVARALKSLDFEVDSSVSPFIDWSAIGGPDYRDAPWYPYRFDPEAPLEPVTDGALLELPTTIGYFSRNQARASRLRTGLESSWLSRLKIVGVLDRLGLLTRRWLSPETASGPEMVRLANTIERSGLDYLSLTFHSCTLLPGATPFVATTRDRDGFLDRIRVFLEAAAKAGWEFRTVSEIAEGVGTRLQSPGPRRRPSASPER